MELILMRKPIWIGVAAAVMAVSVSGVALAHGLHHHTGAPASDLTPATTTTSSDDPAPPVAVTGDKPSDRPDVQADGTQGESQDETGAAGQDPQGEDSQDENAPAADSQSEDDQGEDTQGDEQSSGSQSADDQSSSTQDEQGDGTSQDDSGASQDGDN